MGWMPLSPDGIAMCHACGANWYKWGKPSLAGKVIPACKSPAPPGTSARRVLARAARPVKARTKRSPPMTDPLSPADRAKHAAAAAAVAKVQPGMTLGLGTGSTADWMLRCLAARIRDEGLAVSGVPTSSATAARAGALGIPLGTLDDLAPLDLAIDGADEADPALRLIKGGGGALLQEKIVAAAAQRMVAIADAGKLVGTLGAFPLPVEIVRFGAEATRAAIADLLRAADVDERAAEWRMTGAGRLVTDEGHFLLDLHLGRIGAPAALDAALRGVPGVVETGLFLGLCSGLAVGYPDGRAEWRGPDGTVSALPALPPVADLPA
jgi:ribose 5-phosphate isomerase A